MLGNLAACGMVLVSHPKYMPGFGSTGMHWGPDQRGCGQRDQRVIVESGHWVAEESPSAVASAVRHLLESDFRSDAASRPVM